jgi:hypothetical protein
MFVALPGSAQLRVFQLLCDSCLPDTPGTCLLAPVCKQWRSLACSVKGLRVVLCSDQQQRVDSFCAWLRRHAPQVVALGITSMKAKEVLAALAEAAAAAAAAGGDGGFLPLRHLVITSGGWFDPDTWRALPPLLAALPHLQHLHLHLESQYYGMVVGLPSETVDQAVVAALAPLQHSTSLTSLALRGPSCQSHILDEVYAQLLSGLPPTLRSLEWREMELDDPQGLSFDHLTGLTRLCLGSTAEGDDMDADLPGVSFTALRQPRQLELQGDWVSDQTLLAHQEQLVGLELGQVSPVLPQLTHLQRLRLTQHPEDDYQPPPKELLEGAPPLRELNLFWGHGDSNWSIRWPLQQYEGLTGLEALGVDVVCYGLPPAAPLGMLGLTQLKQLSLSFCYCAPDKTPLASWACVLAGLVNLELLTVPGMLTDCCHPWLIGLTRLAVLEVSNIEGVDDIPAAAAHISQLLAPTPGSSTTAKMRGATGQVRVVCIAGGRRDVGGAAQLHKALVAAVPVLPPNMHLFRGTWQQLQECGVELWPAPVAERLQQLVLR